DFIIGGRAMAGQGWRMLMECLAVGRAITLPSNSTGSAKLLAQTTGAYSRIRRQFKLPIGQLEGIEEPLARLGGNTYAMSAAVDFTLAGIMAGEKPAVISAIVKYHLTSRGQQCSIDAMDIHGGRGICLGPNNYTARHYQGAPIAVTVEGANILTRSMIIFGQGAIRCHPFVRHEMAAAAHPEPSAAQWAAFDQALLGHIGFALGNGARTLWLGLTGAHFAAAPFHDASRRYYQHLARFSAQLAWLSDVAMLSVGGQLKRKERLSARLGDLLSQLYLLSCVLKRFDDDGRPAEDLPLLHWAAQDALWRAQQACLGLLANFPNRPLAWLLRAMLFPFGRPCQPPSDKLEQRVAHLMQTPNPSRERLSAGVAQTPSAHNVAAKLEQALKDMLAAEPIVAALSQQTGQTLPMQGLDQLAANALSHGWLSAKEADVLVRAEASRRWAIAVDSFA
ncbi:MAG: acyl-CoA dehydrogenase, partial [Shewanella sp.]